jgi:hypothetical protein
MKLLRGTRVDGTPVDVLMDEAADNIERLEAIVESVRDYADYRKNNSPCCRDILKLLTGDKTP